MIECTAIRIDGDMGTCRVALEDQGDPEGSYLKGQLTIAGTRFHVEAIEVREGSGEIDGAQYVFNRVVSNAWDERIDMLEDEMQCSFQPVEIDGRQYVVLITPHGR